MAKQAQKQHRVSLECSICHQPREIGSYHAIEIERGKRNNVCTDCLSASKQRPLAPDEIRVKRYGKWHILKKSPCVRCGKIRLARPDQVGKTPYCRDCATFIHVERPELCADDDDSAPRGKYPIKARLYIRCKNGFTGECSKFEECMDVACKKGWDGWRCADRSPTVRNGLDERDKLHDYKDMPDHESYDPFESMLGIQITRAVPWRK